MFQKILIPLDGSGTAETALPYAAELAAKFGSTICLIGVSESKGTETDQSYPAYFERVKESLQRQLRQLGLGEPIKIDSETPTGKPAAEILRFAKEKNFDIIVMSSRGASGPGPWLLGNIAAKILRASTSPVLLIKGPAPEELLKDRSLLKRILVPLDGSEMGKSALEYIIEMAKISLTEIILLQVVRPITQWGMYEGYQSYSPPPQPEDRIAGARNYLEKVSHILEGAGLTTVVAVKFGEPANEIIDYAEKNGVNLIAMSAHGRSGISRWVFGSVTDKVLHAGNSPVLMVPGAGER